MGHFVFNRFKRNLSIRNDLSQLKYLRRKSRFTGRNLFRIRNRKVGAHVVFTKTLVYYNRRVCIRAYASTFLLKRATFTEKSPSEVHIFG